MVSIIRKKFISVQPTSIQLKIYADISYQVLYVLILLLQLSVQLFAAVQAKTIAIGVSYRNVSAWNVCVYLFALAQYSSMLATRR